MRSGSRRTFLITQRRGDSIFSAPERRLGEWGWFGMEYKFYECDKCGNELRLSLELKGASKDKSETGRPIKTQLDDMQWRVEVFEAEVRSVLGELDHLAEVWGDEGVFRRCRDRLRKVLEQCK